jgi:hypothetical protein
MHDKDTLMREQTRFLGQEPERLRAVRGRELYETLGGLGLGHAHFFKALGTNVEDYCAREFGVDLGRITVERFFASDAGAKWLFPDIVRGAVVEGMRSRPRYPELIIRDERVTGPVCDVPHVRESEAGEELRDVAEGAAIPESHIEYGDRVVRLDKRGRGVLASYEVVRRMSVDMLRVHLRRIGERLGRDLDARLAHVLAHGDSSGAGTAPVVLNTAAAGTWDYADLVNGFVTLSLGHYFTPTHLLASADTLMQVLSLDAFQDTVLFDFAKTGRMPSPLGLTMVPMAGQPDHLITLMDAGYAVQKLTEQDLLVESDKLINQQWDRSYLTVVTDFAVIYDKARVVVRNDWS